MSGCREWLCVCLEVSMFPFSSFSSTHYCSAVTSNTKLLHTISRGSHIQSTSKTWCVEACGGQKRLKAVGHPSSLPGRSRISHWAWVLLCRALGLNVGWALCCMSFLLSLSCLCCLSQLHLPNKEEMPIKNKHECVGVPVPVRVCVFADMLREKFGKGKVGWQNI